MATFLINIFGKPCQQKCKKDPLSSLTQTTLKGHGMFTAQSTILIGLKKQDSPQANFQRLNIKKNPTFG